MSIAPRCAQKGTGTASSLTVTLTSFTNSGLGPTGTAPVAGDFVAIMGTVAAASQTVTQTGGTGTWTIAYDDNNSGGTLTTYVAWRLFTGGETNPTFSWTSSVRDAFVALVAASDWGYITAVDVWATSQIDTAASTTHTPNAAAAAGTDLSLLLAGDQTSTNGTTAVSQAAPAGWSVATNGTATNTGTAGTPGYGAATAYQRSVTGTVTPGAWTIQGGSGATSPTFAGLYHVLLSQAPAGARVVSQAVKTAANW